MIKFITSKDLFVLIYCSVWASLLVIFATVTILNNWLKPGDVTLIGNVAFLSVTSIMVFVKPVRRFVDKHIIAKL